MSRRAPTFLVIGLIWMGGQLAVGVVPASATSQSRPGIGSTLKAWKKAYGEKHGPHQFCDAKNSCFGPSLRDPESGFTYEFTNIDVAGGIIDIYQQNFVKNTTLAEVETAIRRTLPSDSVIGPVVVDDVGGSCGFITVTGPTLAKELGNRKVGDPQGIVGIELNTITSNLTSLYDPNNIQGVQFQPLAFDASSAC